MTFTCCQKSMLSCTCDTGTPVFSDISSSETFLPEFLSMKSNTFRCSPVASFSRLSATMHGTPNIVPHMPLLTFNSKDNSSCIFLRKYIITHFYIFVTMSFYTITREIFVEFALICITVLKHRFFVAIILTRLLIFLMNCDIMLNNTPKGMSLWI